MRGDRNTTVMSSLHKGGQHLGLMCVQRHVSGTAVVDHLDHIDRLLIVTELGDDLLSLPRIPRGACDLLRDAAAHGARPVLSP